MIKIETNKNRIYFHKEDIWAGAPHWMSSASRDIYEHFYKAIKSTFLNQFKDKEVQELVQKIQNVRDWEHKCSSIFYNSAKAKTPKYKLPEYKEECSPLPKEYEYDRDSIVPESEMTWDKNIYKSFDDFFNNADHGWTTNNKGKKICKNLYDYFIKDMNKETLKDQIAFELKQSRAWIEFDKETLASYIETKSPLSWHQYMSKVVDDNHD